MWDDWSSMVIHRSVFVSFRFCLCWFVLMLVVVYVYELRCLSGIFAVVFFFRLVPNGCGRWESYEGR